MSGKRWLSPASAADYLDVRADYLPRLVKQGRIPAPDYTLGPRTPRYDRLALDKVMGGEPMEGTQDPDKALALYQKRNQQQGPRRSRRSASNA